jgi:hypothetical protein
VGGTPVVSLVASGNGTSPLTSVTAAPSTLSFGNVTVGSTALWFVTLYNTGNTPVDVTNANLAGGGFDIDRSVLPFTIPVNGSQQMTVSFTPLAAGEASATLTFATNATGTAPSVSLSGTGVFASAHTVNLVWAASASPNVTGYNVYRSTTSGFGFQKINGAPLGQTSFTDAAVASGQTYYYVVTATTASGVESSNSNQVFATIPNP